MRNLEAREPEAGKGTQFLGPRRTTRVRRNYERGQGFPESGLWHAHSADRGDRRVRAQHILDFYRIDVLPAANHHVVPTTAETEITVIVHHTQITGVQPSVGGAG